MPEKMNNLEIIKDVLNNKYLLNQKFLSESDKNTKGKRFETTYPIVSEKINYSLYRFDPRKEDLFPYFSKLSGLKKICDYILFAEEGNILFVFLIELKLGTANARPQLLASKTFIDYVTESARRIGKSLTSEVCCRLIRIPNKKITKGKRNAKEDIEYDRNFYCDYKYSDFRLKLLMK